MRRDPNPNPIVESLTRAALEGMLQDPAYDDAKIPDVINAATSALVSIVGHVGQRLEAGPQQIFLISVANELHALATSLGQGEFQAEYKALNSRDHQTIH